MEPGWLNQDDAHWASLPYQNGLCSSSWRKLFNPLPWSLCSSPCLPPSKNLCLRWDMEVGFVTLVLHLLRRWALRQVPHLPDGWLLNKPLSFTSVPAYWVLAFTVVGSRTYIPLQFSVTCLGQHRSREGPEGPEGPGWEFQLTLHSVTLWNIFKPWSRNTGCILQRIQT